jgi:hypothetical protein
MMVQGRGADPPSHRGCLPLLARSRRARPAGAKTGGRPRRRGGARPRRARALMRVGKVLPRLRRDGFQDRPHLHGPMRLDLREHSLTGRRYAKLARGWPRRHWVGASNPCQQPSLAGASTALPPHAFQLSARLCGGSVGVHGAGQEGRAYGGERGRPTAHWTKTRTRVAQSRGLRRTRGAEPTNYGRCSRP